MTYRIKNWDMYFEKSDTRKCKNMRWIALPNKHDGKGFRRVAKHERNVELFTAWILILQVASKMPEHGLLVDEDGPLDAHDLSDMTGFPTEIFNMAFTVLTEKRIGWIERVSGIHPEASGSHPEVSGLQDKTLQDRTLQDS